MLRLKPAVPDADTRVMAIAALEFQPIFVYVAAGLAGLIAFTRILLNWAVGN